MLFPVMQYIQKRKNDTYFGQMTETSQRKKIQIEKFCWLHTTARPSQAGDVFHVTRSLAGLWVLFLWM